MKCILKSIPFSAFSTMLLRTACAKQGGVTGKAAHNSSVQAFLPESSSFITHFYDSLGNWFACCNSRSGSKQTQKSASGKRLNWIKAVTAENGHLDDKALPTSQLPFLSTGQPVVETCLFTQVWPRVPHVKCEGHLETFSKATGFSSREGWHSATSKSKRECPLATEAPPNLMPCHFTEPKWFLLQLHR